MGRAKKQKPENKYDVLYTKAQAHYNEVDNPKQVQLGEDTISVHSRLSFDKYIEAVKEYCNMVISKDPTEGIIHHTYLDEYAKDYVFTKYYTDVELDETDHMKNWVVVRYVFDSLKELKMDMSELDLIIDNAEKWIEFNAKKNDISVQLANVLSSFADVAKNITGRVQSLPDSELKDILVNFSKQGNDAGDAVTLEAIEAATKE